MTRRGDLGRGGVHLQRVTFDTAYRKLNPSEALIHTLNHHYLAGRHARLDAAIALVQARRGLSADQAFRLRATNTTQGLAEAHLRRPSLPSSVVHAGTNGESLERRNGSQQ